MILVMFSPYTIYIWTANSTFVGLVWRQGPWKRVVLCFAVPGTGLTPALAAFAGDETAETFCGVSWVSRDGPTPWNQRILQAGKVL